MRNFAIAQKGSNIVILQAIGLNLSNTTLTNKRDAHNYRQSSRRLAHSHVPAVLFFGSFGRYVKRHSNCCNVIKLLKASRALGKLQIDFLKVGVLCAAC
jgi:hypothetical protein